MISISHWGMFDARNIPYRYWPLRFGNGVDIQFEEARAEYERCRLELVRLARPLGRMISR